MSSSRSRRLFSKTSSGRSRQRPPSPEPPSPEQRPPSPPLSTTIPASHVHNQLQSPLFATLYPELRNIVFIFALTEYDDPNRPYSKHECYYRPGFEFAGRIDTSLLLTCRLVYLETHLAPVAVNEHVFWMHPNRGPPGRSISNLDHNRYFWRMTPQQRAAVDQVRFFAQLYWLERCTAQTWPMGLAVGKLVITVRHADWWYWERNEPLRINPPHEAWDKWVGAFPQLQELVLEFETIEAKREQLEERVRIALGWKFPLADGSSLVHDGKAPVKSMWMGTSRMSPRFVEIAWNQPQDAATLDLSFSMDLKLHVRKFKFVKQSQLR
ncbi:hypothetical protein B0H19DRAFT_1149921 [Mycena capillaripes]|nr:hypothetical protein B0H19DRAFT_1149921 [Mycena capillaripes]